MTLLFVFVLLGGLVAMVPAPFVAEQMKLKARGFTYSHASGTIWDAEFQDLAYGIQEIGDLELQLKPVGLLTGKAQLAFDLAGPVGTVRGEADISANRTVTLRDTIADIQLQSLLSLHDQLRAAPSKLDIVLRELSLTGQGACLASDMRIRSDAVREIGRRWQWEGPVLEGNVTCDGRAFQAVLEGPESAADKIQAAAKVDLAASSYSSQADVETENPDLQNALIALGFTYGEGRYSYLRTNQDMSALPQEIQQ
ncbi:MAG: type II secretion system protein N [Hyphomonadaceae bacterium]|nr:type II secretion system protein N [Hyphomonadaceae bacterium]